MHPLLTKILDPPLSDLPFFTQERSQEGEKRGSFTHEQNITCSQTKLDIIVHEQTINKGEEQKA